MIRWLPVLMILTACAFQSDPQNALQHGESVYNKACASCHDTGQDGAQLIGDHAGWRSRLAQGMPALIQHSIEGFNGAVGHMPARGGDPSLSDSDVAAAVDYLVGQSR